MKNLSKILILLAVAAVFASCGGKKENVYDAEYEETGISDGGNQDKNDADRDKTGGKDGETAVNDSETGEKEEENADIDESGSETDSDDAEIDDAAEISDSDEISDSGEISDSDEADYEPADCTGFSLESEGRIAGSVPSTTYSVKIADNILGDPGIEDWFELRLDHARVEGDPYVSAGTFDLKEGVSNRNSSYWRCWECVSVKQDEGSEKEKFFFQRSGTLTIETVDEGCNFTGVLSAVLVESVIENYDSKPIKNGDCIEIETAIDATTLCSRNCKDKPVGANDGCCDTCKE